VAVAPAVQAAPVAAAPAPTVGGEPLTAPLPGSIFSLKCQVGDTVNEGDTVLIMESMKMETEIKATKGGTIQTLLVKEGDKVQTGDSLAIIG
jgi:oxaloacetate decarboxylase alpha subunit